MTTTNQIATVAGDIRHVVIERGALTQNEIIDLWELDPVSYDEVKAILSVDRALRPGPRGQGGFHVRAKVGERLPEETEGLEQYFTTTWESGAVERLVHLLTHKELEDLLGDLVYTVRRARREITGKDRRGTKSELASALIIQHGNDLFCNKEARLAVARKCGTDAPKKWMPGKDSAIRFVQASQFPLVFAGAPAAESRPDYEFLKGRIDLKPLSDFQQEVGIKMLQRLRTQNSRAIVTLPTGAGKTRVAVDTIRDWLIEHWSRGETGVGNTILWLAHTEELCEQAYMCFRDVWQASTNVSPLWLIRFWGKYTQDLAQHWHTLVNLREHPATLISTPQRIINLYKSQTGDAQNMTSILNETIGLLLIDEAHRAAAPTYRGILERTSQEADLSVIGLTATPFRSVDPEAGARELKSIFREIIEPIKTLGPTPHVELQRQGYLAQPIWDTIQTNTIQRLPTDFDPETISFEDIDKIDHALKARADNTDRRMIILRHILPICDRKDTQAIYFGPSVLDAECMAFLLRQNGINAAFISGETRDITRRRIINDFKEGRTRVLCNCEVLTTGFDAPRVTHVIMARPTVSQVMYEQMLGRGLRGPTFGGTEKCVVIDCEDNYPGGRPAVGYEAYRRTWGARR
jgi:superfamily II DNA or RNA helicase